MLTFQDSICLEVVRYNLKILVHVRISGYLCTKQNYIQFSAIFMIHLHLHTLAHMIY